MLTQKELKDLFIYTNGKLIAKDRLKTNNMLKDLNLLDRDGIIRDLKEHIFIWHYGYAPRKVRKISAKNTRIENLRDATINETMFEKLSKECKAIMHEEGTKYVVRIQSPVTTRKVYRSNRPNETKMYQIMTQCILNVLQGNEELNEQYDQLILKGE